MTIFINSELIHLACIPVLGIHMLELVIGFIELGDGVIGMKEPLCSLCSSPGGGVAGGLETPIILLALELSPKVAEVSLPSNNRTTFEERTGLLLF